MWHNCYQQAYLLRYGQEEAPYFGKEKRIHMKKYFFFAIVFSALAGSKIASAQLPDVPLPVCAFKQQNGAPCDEVTQYCMEGCPLLSSAHSNTDTAPGQTRFWRVSTSQAEELVVGAGLAIGITVAIFFAGGLVSALLVGSGLLVVIGGWLYVVNFATPARSSVAGDWKGRYVINAPPECKGQEGPWGNVLQGGNPEGVLWSAGGFTFSGKVTGNTISGAIIGEPCPGNAKQIPVSGTFFGGRIVPVE